MSSLIETTVEGTPGHVVYYTGPAPTPAGPKHALKQTEGKAQLSQISMELMDLLARVRMFGSQKYSRGDWKHGFPITVSCDAALRHIFKFLAGETNDDESGLLHLGHAVADLEHAIYDMKHHPENDDRDKKE